MTLEVIRLCGTADRGAGKKSFKKFIMATCQE